jgi:hypothetical protein
VRSATRPRVRTTRVRELQVGSGTMVKTKTTSRKSRKEKEPPPPPHPALAPDAVMRPTEQYLRDRAERSGDADKLWTCLVEGCTETFAINLNANGKLNANGAVIFSSIDMCPTCSIDAKQRPLMRKPLPPIQLACPCCSERFATLQILLRHHARKHVVDKAFECNKCQLAFKVCSLKVPSCFGTRLALLR